MKIGILTLPVSHNYGHVLQLFALYTILKKMGHDPIVLNRRWNNIGHTELLTKFKRFVYQNTICYEFTSFVRRHLVLSREVRSTAELSTLVHELNLSAIIVGSDQVWRIEHIKGADLNYFIDFDIDKSVRKISYAASFGVDKWNGTREETEEVKKLLNNFNSISVREDTGILICKEEFDLQASCVLDPTLLLSHNDYENLFSLRGPVKTLATYILDINTSKSRFVSEVAGHLSLKPLDLYKGDRALSKYKSIAYWLSSIKHSSFVIVDSFHGMVFSIIFHKQFVVICNKERGATRFTSLLKQLGLEDRLIYDTESVPYEVLEKPIDYTLVNNRLDVIKKTSISFLRNALI